MLGSLFRPLGILYVRITFHYRTTLCRLQNLLSYGFLLCIQLCCCLLFIVREYGEFNSYILYSCHPLNVPLHRILFTSEPTFGGLVTHSLYHSETGRWFHSTISCPSNIFVLTSTFRGTHRLADLCYSLASIITVGTRFPDLRALRYKCSLYFLLSGDINFC